MPAKELGSPSHLGFEPKLGCAAGNIARNPIRGVMAKYLAKKETCLMLAGGFPIANVFPSICGADPDETLMNYGPNLGRGHPDAIAWAKLFMQEHHAMPSAWAKHGVIMTPGNTNAIAMNLLLCTDAGDTVLCEEFTYTGLVAAAHPLGRKVRGVRMDAMGLCPDSLRTCCAELAAKDELPRLLYLVPTAQNPTGITMPESRRREIYSVARDYKLLLLEDDPYYFLSLGPAEATCEAEMPGLNPGSVPPSFLAIDTDARVCRLDSCSKFLAPGFRLGWMTAPKPIIDKMAIMAEVLTWSLSGFTQQAFIRCQQQLGRDGLHLHVQRMQWAYRQRRDWLMKAFEQHLSGLASWNVPHEGMFLWLEVLSVENAGQLAEPLIDEGIALVPGAAFLAKPYSRPCSKFRVSFTQVTEESAMEAAKRLAAALSNTEFLAKNGMKRLCDTIDAEPPSKACRLA